MDQLTKEQAIELAKTEWWKDVNFASVAAFQVTQNKLCCPIDVYKESLVKTLNREVFTHELSQPEKLIAEMNKEKKAPSFAEIVAMMPQGKSAVIKPKG